MIGITFWLIWSYYTDNVNTLASHVTEKTYRYALKPLLFQMDAEFVHNRMTSFGEHIGTSAFLKKTLTSLLTQPDAKLSQDIAGITFPSPIGLAAGFDYEGRLTQITHALGFGFQTVGTITNKPYDGNPKPRLVRLPKSQSLLVNKGFKNRGAKYMAKKLGKQNFPIPIGISIGRTNSASLTQRQSVEDILSAFNTFEKSSVRHSYYELNISCPNLYGDVTFYTKNNLSELLTEVDKLHLTRPVFIKMPIERPNSEVLELLDVIVQYSPTGIIIGNLQKDRHHPSLHSSEIAKFKKGNFSGKPTFSRSNELIRLAYRHYHNRLVIIGCGGVFSAEDAFIKLTCGASLVQMITGMIYQGPQVIGKIQQGLLELFSQYHIMRVKDAVGLHA